MVDLDPVQLLFEGPGLFPSKMGSQRFLIVPPFQYQQVFITCVVRNNRIGFA